MSGLPDWTVWVLAAGIVAIFAWFFWETGRTLLQTARHLISTIQNWPQIRRNMTEAEVQSGGRYPWWFRAVRVFLVLAMIAFAGLLIWRKFTAP